MRPRENPVRIFNFLEMIEAVVLNWYLVLLAVVFGAILGFLFALVRGRVFEAAAVVQVDHNPDLVMNSFTRDFGLQRVGYLEEQTRLLESVAVSDDVLDRMAVILGEEGIPVPSDHTELLNNSLLPHAAQAKWRFVFREEDSGLAAAKANAWAHAFLEVVDEGVLAAQKLRAQVFAVNHLSVQLVNRRWVCAELPAWLEDLDDDIEQLANVLPEDDFSPLLITKYGEAAAYAGLFRVLETGSNLTNQEALSVLEELRSEFEKIQGSCGESLILLQEELDKAIEIQSQLSTRAAGYNPDLEVRLLNEASVSSVPAVGYGRTVLVGAASGLLLGILFVIIHLLSRNQREN